MKNLACKVRSIRTCQKDVSSGHLNGHAWPVEWSFANTQPLHDLRRIALGGWLKRCPAVKTLAQHTVAVVWPLCLHDSWSNCIDSDAVFCLLLGQRAREGCNGAFGGGVVDELGVAHVGSNRSRIDYAIATLHVVQSELGHGKHGEHVGPVGFLNGLKVDVTELVADLLHRACVGDPV